MKKSLIWQEGTKNIDYLCSVILSQKRAEITYALTTIDDKLDGNFVSIKTQTVDLPACTWEQGKQYTYNLVIGIDKVVFNPAIDVSGWGEDIIVPSV